MSKISICRLQMIREKQFEYDAQISQSQDVYDISVKLGYEDFAEEVFGMFCLNSKGVIEDYMEVSHGDLTTSTAHPREVFKRALVANAQCVIFVHNHPSGDPAPSEEDKTVTKRLLEAGELLGVKVLDHIIIGDRRFLSMKEESFAGIPL